MLTTRRLSANQLLKNDNGNPDRSGLPFSCGSDLADCFRSRRVAGYSPGRHHDFDDFVNGFGVTVISRNLLEFAFDRRVPDASLPAHVRYSQPAIQTCARK